MSDWSIVSWSIIYALSAIISLAISLDIILKRRESSTHQQFFVYGLATSLSLFASFLKLNAPEADLALTLFRLSNALYFISIGVLALFVYELMEPKKGSWLLLMPPMFAVLVGAFLPYDKRLTEYGWVFLPGEALTAENVIIFAYLFCYSLLVGFLLYDYMRRAKTPWLQRKYGLMLLGFVVFQMVGVVSFNALMMIYQNIPPTTGPFYLVSLLFLWYGFKMQPKEVKLTQEGGKFSTAYRKFINRFLEVAPSDELGLKTFNLLEYLDKTRLSELVTYDRLRIILNVNNMEQLDNIQALDKTMEYLEGKEWSGGLASPFTDVLESVHQSILDAQGTLEPFRSVLLGHQDFLKRADVIYGFSQGQFLELFGPDNSLVDRPEWEVALRTYKRWLLPIRAFLVGDVAAEFYKMLRSTDIVKYIDVFPDGEIAVDKVLSHVEALPQERRTEAVRAGFNIVMSWVAKSLAEKDPASFVKWMKLIRRIMILNMGAKGVQRTFASVVARLSRDMGRSRIRDLILLEGHKAEELDAFSANFSLSHEDLLHERVLVECDPRFSYEYYIGRLLSEVSANTERCVLFTRSGGVIQRMAAGLENVECRILATPGVEEENSVPFNDITRLIHAVSTALDSEMETWILFDNLSDLIIPVGVEQAYVFARHATDLIGARNGSAVFLMNKSAHGQSDRAAFEGLFSKIMEIGEEVILVKR